MTTQSIANDSHLQPAVAAEFASLADLLAAASDAQWDTPSMCEGWRVREVVAHMTMAARYQFGTLDTAVLTAEMADHTAEVRAPAKSRADHTP